MREFTSKISDKDLYDKNNIIYVSYNDTQDKFGHAKKREIENIIQKKYGCTKPPHVVFNRIIYKGVNSDERVDLSANIVNTEFQFKLVNDYLKENGFIENIDYNLKDLLDLDEKINQNDIISSYISEKESYKNFNIQKIEFSNVLSYGDNNVMYFNQKRGITTIVSNPANQGGKTVLAVDLILLLFYGTSLNDRVKSLEDIFNRHRPECNTVKLKGYIEIGGEVLIIERILTKKIKNNNDIEVSQSVELYQIDDNGNRIVHGGSNQKAINEIKERFGTKEDLQTTILVTGENLTDLITTKPTERGRLLTRFIGLDLLEKKGQVAKDLYNKWKKTALIYRTDTNKVVQDIENYNTEIENIKLTILQKDQKLNEIEIALNGLRAENNELMRKLHNNIDKSLYQINLERCNENIQGYQRKIDEIKTKLVELQNNPVIKPDTELDVSFYDIEQKQKNKEREYSSNITMLETQITFNKKQINDLKNSEFCPTCGAKLNLVDHTAEIISLEKILSDNEDNLEQIKKKHQKILSNLTRILDIKKGYDDFLKYENLLQKLNNELNNFETSLINEVNIVNNYNLNQQMIVENKKTETEINVIVNKIRNLENENNQVLLSKGSYNEKIVGYENKIKECKELQSSFELEVKIENNFKLYLDVFGKNGIAKMVLNKQLPTINAKIKDLISEYCSFDIVIEENEGDISFLIIDKLTNIAGDLASGSGFERTMGSLGIRCVLSEFCSLPKPNIIVFDEITGTADVDINLVNIGKLLKKLVDDNHYENVFLISHIKDVQEWGDHQIRIEKVEGISTIIEQ